MDTKMSAVSLIDEADVKVAETASKSAEASAETSKKRTRKVKPYDQLKKVQAHTAGKKEEKKSGTKVRKGVSTAGKKPTGKAPSKKEAKSGSAPSKGPVSGKCSICGKSLSRHSSVTNGAGDVCLAKLNSLPKGFDNFKDYYDSFKVVDEPGADYLTVREAIKIAKKKGVSQYAFLIAMGGNRMVRPPLTKAFKVIVYRNTRYVPKASTTDKELKALLKK